MTAPMPETMSPREKVVVKQPCDHCQRMTVVDPAPILAALASSGDHAELARLAVDPAMDFGGFGRSRVLALIAEVAALRVDRDEWRNWYRKASAEINAQDERATEAERKLAEAVEWRPIETAPRDGTVVLGFWRFRTFDSYVITPVTLRPDGGWVQKWDHDEVSPTHWLPLPPAPGAEDE